MHYGFRIVEDMADGLAAYMDDHAYRSTDNFRGRAVANVMDWGDLNLNYKIIAKIDADLCIGCQLCYVACDDGAHQCIERAPQQKANGKQNSNGMEVHVPRIIEEDWCRLQPVRAGLPRTRLHHDGGNPHRLAADVLETKNRPRGSVKKRAQIWHVRQFHINRPSVIAQRQLDHFRRPHVPHAPCSRRHHPRLHK